MKLTTRKYRFPAYLLFDSKGVKVGELSDIFGAIITTPGEFPIRLSCGFASSCGFMKGLDLATPERIKSWAKYFNATKVKQVIRHGEYTGYVNK